MRVLTERTFTRETSGASALTWAVMNGSTAIDLLRFAAELVVIVGALYLGVRQGGVALGLWGVLGGFAVILVLKGQAGSFPYDTIMITLAATVAVAALEAAGEISTSLMCARRCFREPRS